MTSEGQRSGSRPSHTYDACTLPTASRVPQSRPTCFRWCREQPGIAGFGGEQDQLTDGDDAAVVIGRVALNVAHLIGQTKILAPDDLLAGSAPGSFATLGGSWGGCHGIIHPAVR